MREIVRTSWLPTMTEPVDVVLRALPPAYKVSFGVLREQLDALLARLPARRAPDDG